MKAHSMTTPDTSPENQKRIRLVLVAEFNPTVISDTAEAQRQLDAFREAVLPGVEFGITLYRANTADMGQARKDPAFPEGWWVPDTRCVYADCEDPRMNPHDTAHSPVGHMHPECAGAHKESKPGVWEDWSSDHGSYNANE